MRLRRAKPQFLSQPHISPALRTPRNELECYQKVLGFELRLGNPVHQRTSKVYPSWLRHRPLGQRQCWGKKCVQRVAALAFCWSGVRSSHA